MDYCSSFYWVGSVKLLFIFVLTSGKICIPQSDSDKEDYYRWFCTYFLVFSCVMNNWVRTSHNLHLIPD